MLSQVCVVVVVVVVVGVMNNYELIQSDRDYVRTPSSESLFQDRFKFVIDCKVIFSSVINTRRIGISLSRIP